MTKKKYIKIFISVVILVFIEQIIKVFVLNHETSNIVKNTGIAFGIGQERTISIIITNLIILLIILRFLIKQINIMNMWSKISIALILAGGISNLVDRIFRGYVLDYIDINQIIKFPIFNLADIYIVLGWILFAFNLAIFTNREIIKIRSKK